VVADAKTHEILNVSKGTRRGRRHCRYAKSFLWTYR